MLTHTSSHTCNKKAGVSIYNFYDNYRGGRPKIDLSSIRLPLSDGDHFILLKDHYPEALNTLPLTAIGRNHSQPCIILRLCKVHAAWVHLKSVIDSYQYQQRTALDCKVCEVFNNTAPQTRATKYEKTTYAAIQALPPDLSLQPHEWHTDSVVLEYTFAENKSSVDVFVPKYKLCIMTDGEHHFTKKRTNKRKVTRELTAPARRQQEIDSTFNHAAFMTCS